MKKNKQLPTSRRPIEKAPASTKAFSYYSNRSSTDSNTGSRLKKEARKGLQWQLVPSFIAVLAIFVSLVYVSTLTTSPRLSVKGPDSVLLRDQDDYTDAAQELLQESVFSRSKLSINTKSIERKMLERFPELRTVGITLPLTGRRPIVTVEAVEPRLALRTTEGVYILDNRGRAVFKALSDDLVNQQSLPVVLDETGLEIVIGNVALSSRDTAFITELHHQLSDKKISVASLVLPPIVNELHLRILDEPYYVKFNMLGDARLQAGSLIAIREKLQGDGVKPSEYIDVRVEEKVFYK